MASTSTSTLTESNYNSTRFHTTPNITRDNVHTRIYKYKWYDFVYLNSKQGLTYLLFDQNRTQSKKNIKPKYRSAGKFMRNVYKFVSFARFVQNIFDTWLLDGYGGYFIYTFVFSVYIYCVLYSIRIDLSFMSSKHVCFLFCTHF